MNMLNISVDTLRPERFEQMTRRRGHERVMDAIHNAIRLGYDPVKVIFLTPLSGCFKSAPCFRLCAVAAFARSVALWYDERSAISYLHHSKQVPLTYCRKNN